MGETKDLPASTIKYEGIFDWHQMYQLLRSWSKERQFEFTEKKHVVKKPGTYGYDLEFEAVLEREETRYFKFKVEIAIKSAHTEDVEIIVNGEKKQKNKTGLMAIELKPSVELDWNKKFDEKSKFKKGLRTFMHSFVMKKDIDASMNKLYHETYQLQTKLRESLDLQHKYNAYAPWHTKN